VGYFKHPISQRGFSVVDVRYDAKVSDFHVPLVYAKSGNYQMIVWGVAFWNPLRARVKILKS